MTNARRSYIRRPRTPRPVSLTPREVAAAYHFPIAHATGAGYIGGIIELGGGFKQSQVAQYFTREGLPMPKFVSVGVNGARNSPDGPGGADGEVQLDMIVAGAVAPGATYRIYFAPNDDAGFLAAIERARDDGCNGISISWGGPENDWDPATMRQYEDAIAAARAKGVPVFAASGDTGSEDSSGAGNQTDFPASSPSAIGCGGTTLTITPNGERASEVVWNDDPTTSATGGGVSKAFPGRDVPDIAGNADPDTGYEVMIDGQPAVIGGTSAVAPLMLGLHALLWELNGGKPFDFLNLVVTNPQACFDVTIGDNGGYRAGPGRDQTTGFGVPDGALLLAALRSGIPAPVPPAPVSGGGPGNGGGGSGLGSDPLSDFPVDAIHRLISHKHNYTRTETAAVNALQQWATHHGLTL
jgi:kumamolisin